MVTQVLKLDARDLAEAISGDSFAWQGAVFRWRSLAAMLHAPNAATSAATNAAAARRTTILLLSQAGSQLALAVDAVDARRDLTMRDPSPQLLSVPGMIGASPAADGTIVLVMNPFALADAAHASAALMAAPFTVSAAPTILVVDDSRMVRVVFAEQLYRAVTLLDGHPYHRE